MMVGWGLQPRACSRERQVRRQDRALGGARFGGAIKEAGWQAWSILRRRQSRAGVRGSENQSGTEGGSVYEMVGQGREGVACAEGALQGERREVKHMLTCSRAHMQHTRMLRLSQPTFPAPSNAASVSFLFESAVCVCLASEQLGSASLGVWPVRPPCKPETSHRCTDCRCRSW